MISFQPTHLGRHENDLFSISKTIFTYQKIRKIAYLIVKTQALDTSTNSLFKLGPVQLQVEIEEIWYITSRRYSTLQVTLKLHIALTVLRITYLLHYIASLGSPSFSDGLSVRSPQKLFTFIIWWNSFWIKVSKKILYLILETEALVWGIRDTVRWALP